MADNADFVPQKLSRKQTMEMQAKHMEELQKSDPDTDFKVDEEWWAPGINLAFDVKVSCCYIPLLVFYPIP